VRQDRRTAFFTICAEREDCCTDRNEIAAGRAGGEYPVEERCNGLLGGLAQRLGVIVLGLAPVSLCARRWENHPVERLRLCRRGRRKSRPLDRL